MKTGSMLIMLAATCVGVAVAIPLRAQSPWSSATVQATGTVTVISGFIVAANLANGGSGHPEAPLVSVMDASGSHAVIAAAISDSGVVTNLTISNAGSHYSAAASLRIAPPPTNTSWTDIPVSISLHVTDNIRTWTSGTNYPAGGVYTNYAGITFYLTRFHGITNGLGTVFTGYGSMIAPKTNNFPVNVTNAATVYTLMNSFDGKLGTTNGTLDFYGSRGDHATFNLVQGFNLRDHYNGSFQNVVSSNIMSLYWGASKSVRLDCQGWMLPTNFYSQILTNIQVRSFGNNPNGVPTLTAVTIRTSGPLVAIRPVGNQAACFWPSTPTNYILQTSADLGNPAWMMATNSLLVMNNQFVVTNLMTTTNQFYRLIAVP